MKLKKIFAGMAAAALAASMTIAASAEALEMSNTSVTMNDGGIRVNVWNPWGQEQCHAIAGEEGYKKFANGAKFDITVKCSDVEALGSYKIWVNASNFGKDDDEFSYWGSGAGTEGKKLTSTEAEVTADGEYTVTLTCDEGTVWLLQENNFMMIGSNIDADKWLTLGKDDEGKDVGNPATLQIVAIDVTYGEPATGDSSAADSTADASSTTESKADASSTADASSATESKADSKADSKASSTAATTTSSKAATTTTTAASTAAASSDNTANTQTGATAGIALAGIALAGAVAVVAKKKN